MIRLLLVDDETVTREGLLGHIPWQELGVSEVEEADCGEKAIEKIQNFLPDIVITDIRMPNMDGIELSNVIKNNIPHCKIIYISGYSDKEYLKSAIKLQIIDYIEKPINIEELSSVIKKAVRLCLEDKQYLKDIGQLKRQNRHILMKKFLTECIKGNADAEYYGNMLRELQLDKPKMPVRICVIKIRKNPAGEWNNAALAEEIKEEKIEKFLAQYTEIYGKLEHKEWVALLERLPLAEYHLIDLFQSNIERILADGFECFAAIGTSADAADRLYLSYDDACRRLRRKMFFGAAYLETGKEPKKDAELEKILNEIGEKVINCESPVAAYKVVDKSVWEIVKCELTVDEILNYIYKMMISVYETAKRAGIEEDNITREKHFFEIVSRTDITLGAVREFIRQEIEEMFAKKASMLSKDKMILQAVRYIEKNYQDAGLTEQNIADFLYISASYLSKLFKQKTGKNINSYITEIRMKQAKELLRQPRYKLYEIAAMVGYSDGNYFTKIFKKYTGLTPSEYRKGIER